MEDNKEQNADVSSPCSDKKDEWSNMKCIYMAFEEKFPIAVGDINVQKGIINRFLNFYLGTKVQKGLNVTDLVFSTIAIMPLHKVTEEFIWDPEFYDINGTHFFLSAEDKLKAELNDLKERTEGRDKSELVERKTEKIVENEENTDETENDIKKSDKDYGESCSQEEQQSAEPGLESKKHVENESKVIYESKIDEENGTTYAKTNNKSGISPKLPTDILWYGNINKRYRVAVENARITYGPKENSAFAASCGKLLEEWDTNARGRIALKYFFGIVALTLMRACTKTYMHLVNTFASSKFRDSVSFIGGYFNYSVPQKRCVKGCYRTFKKRDDNTAKMFAKIVLNSFHIDKLRREDGYSNLPVNIFKFTLLAHTAGHGFGLVTMLQSIDRHELVIEATYCDETADSWHKLKNFLEKYMRKTSTERTHHWARVINSDYFKDLSCNSNYALAVILAVFNEKENKNSGIWDSTWVKRGEYGENGNNLDKYKELGRVMYEKYVKATSYLQMDLIHKQTVKILNKYKASLNSESNSIDENGLLEFLVSL